ncbi:MAG: hypothetical protein KBT30_01070 [Clostridiales bacterium]|nr:hypothetical protein [Candidatus Apopatousia equi]
MKKDKIKIDSSSFVDKESKLSGNITIGKNCRIENCVLKDVVIKDNTIIKFSDIDGAKIGEGVSIGPYARIRPFSVLEDKVHIGNFVEIKNSHIKKGSKVPHLSYVGDATIGEDCNIGCGVIFCNYDGQNKTHSFVGDRVFIGSNVNIVSPVVIESDSFIAAGTTITKNIKKNEFCMGRVKDEIISGVQNNYSQKFKGGFKYFGTDGIRDVYGQKLNDELCIKVGYALTKVKDKPKVLIGRDTRPSGINIFENLSKGIESGGGEVFDAGIISTAGLAYLTKQYNFDYGVIITASHNPSEYNGIKVFNKKGFKISENEQLIIEENLAIPKKIKQPVIKKFNSEEYFEHLKKVCDKKCDDLSVFVDLSNGAISKYGKQIIETTGAKVKAIHTGGEINKNTSVLDEKVFIKNMKKSGCDLGFCFDGDADRVMCITKNLKVLDGDKILYILTKYEKENCVVGTIMTNMAMEKQLEKIGSHLIRTQVGDKCISNMMKSKNCGLGAEQSGHVIIGKLTTTGDGLLTALYLLKVYKEQPKFFDEAEKITVYSTISKSVKTERKEILKNKVVQEEISLQERLLKSSGRVIVRASGTEPKIRITVEAKVEKQAVKVANRIEQVILKELEK